MRSKKKSTSIRLIRKSNDLVEGKYRFDIWEMRVFTKMLTLIHKDDEEFKEYRIFLKDVITDFGIEKDKNAYRFIKQGAEKLTKKEIRIVRDTDEGEKEFLTHIAVGMDSFTNLSEGRYIDISFHPKMKPFLLQLQEQFLMYDIQNIMKLQSSFSIRIYELLKQYESIGKRRITITELKEMLDVVDKYKLYGHFKDRVILKAKADLEEFTDIKITFIEEKKGRSVYAIVFTIEPNRVTATENRVTVTENKVPKIEILTQLTSPESTEVTEIYELIKDFKGANSQTVREWVQQFSPDYVRQRINLVKNQLALGSKVRNPMGYLHKMMSQINLFDPIEELRREKQQATDTKMQTNQTIQRLAAELERLKATHYESQSQMIDRLLAEDEALRNEVQNNIQHSSYYDHKLPVEQNMKKGMIQGMIFTKVKQYNQSIFEKMDSQFELQEKALKSQLRALGWNI